MNKEVVEISRTEKRIFYKADRLASVTDKLLEKLEWPAASDGSLGFVFEEEVENEHGLLAAGLSERYFARFIYSAKKQDIVIPAGMPSVRGIAPHTFKDLQELKSLFLGTNKNFSEEWKKQLKDRYAALIEQQADADLPTARVSSFEKDGKVVSLFTMTKVKGYLGAPVDWLHWAWIDSALPREERGAVHNFTAEWVLANVEREIQCNIFAFNSRSQKFFRKLGFRPKCLYIVREQ